MSLDPVLRVGMQGTWKQHIKKEEKREVNHKKDSEVLMVHACHQQLSNRNIHN